MKRIAAGRLPNPSDEKLAWGDENQGLILALSLSNENVTSGEPVEMRLTIKNTSNKSVMFFKPYLKQNPCITVMNSGNTKLPITVDRLSSRISTTVELKPGTFYDITIELSEICDISKKGKYFIQAPDLMISPINLTKPPILLKSNTATLTVN